METKVIQLRARGTLTLPSSIRERYGLNEGDPMTLVDMDGVLLLAPRINLVSKLVGEIERIRLEAGVSMDDLMRGVSEERQRYYEERQGDATQRLDDSA